jgi:hypothetical protein
VGDRWGWGKMYFDHRYKNTVGGGAKLKGEFSTLDVGVLVYAVLLQY